MSLRILIVGAGYSGTVIALQLMRPAMGRSIEIVLAERGSDVARGQAYAAHDFPYVLNVPASRMSATGDDPDEFLRFAKTRIPAAAAGDFLPRRLYGDYLARLLDRAIANLPPNILFRSVRADVVAVDEEAGQATAATAEGANFSADRIVIANGMPPPAMPRSIRCTIGPPVLRATPWSTPRALAGPGAIFVIGTGLTMVDVACETVARNPHATIHAISRHGLLAESQTDFHVKETGSDRTLNDAAGSTRRMFAAVRHLARTAEDRGEDWREVITQVRARLPSLWNDSSLDERRRFLRHVRCWWDVHRSRLPPEVRRQLDEMRRAGQLVLHAGRIHSIEAQGEGARVSWQRRGTAAHESLVVDEVVNCSGPDYDLSHTVDPLWRSLLTRGLAMPDPLGLGVRTSSGRFLDRHGNASRRLHYIGPLLRADYWESTAAAELRGHAEALAARLLAWV